MTFKGHCAYLSNSGAGVSSCSWVSDVCNTLEPVFLFVFVGVASALVRKRPVSPAILDSTQSHESRPH